ncbi:MAG: PEP-CTERM sorting domain-containing protein, partial [Verrucomicrobiales bacterium]|nr:PEP-CTERM sorting domain-containing protein [Verrucomicrobiales bacterium]
GLGGGAMPMPGGWGILINPVTDQFLAMAYNVFPFGIPAGETFVARATATVYADPADLEMPFNSFFDVFFELDLNIPGGMQAFGGGPPPPLPNNMLFTGREVPEPASVMMLLFGLTALILRRRGA